MSRTVLFAGGPLHGRTMTVDDHAPTVLAVEPCGPDLFRQVLYTVSRFAMCGRIIWIGHPGANPDEALVFEVLTSDGAKAASYVPDQAPV